jgi:hypothetical protein
MIELNILRHINPIHTLRFNLYNIHFCIIVTSSVSPQFFRLKLYKLLSSLKCMLHPLPISTLLEFVTLISGDEYSS